MKDVITELLPRFRRRDRAALRARGKGHLLMALLTTAVLLSLPGCAFIWPVALC